MEVYKIISKKLLLLLAPVSFLLLASCGSYQYSGYENDGIYGENNRSSVEEQKQYAEQDEDRSYYKNLFSEEAALYGDVLAEDAIFTDVESYSSTGDYDPAENQETNYQGGNAPWGQDPDEYTINIYNTGFHGGFFNPYWGGGIYAFDPFWGPGYYGPGFYGPGYWGSPWGIGYGGFYGAGFGMGYGFAAHPFIFGSGRWYNPYNFHGNRYQNFNQNVAYNSGRRNATSTYNRRANTSSVRNAAVLDSRGRSSSYSRSIRNLRNSNDDYGVTRRSYSNNRVNADSRYRTTRSQPNINRSSRNTNNTYSRSSTPTRRNTGAVRSSTNTRSSGAVRSSGSTGRSSGSTSRGRGN